MAVDLGYTREEQQALDIKNAYAHPACLLEYVTCIDNTTGEEFHFQLLDKEAPWHWQREVLDGWINSDKSIALKARQIGITWLAAGYALWTMLYVPGTKVLIVSINENEAVKVVNRIWDMYLSLPEHLRPVKAVKPLVARPSQQIQLEHADGRISTCIGLPSTKSAGHGETAALVILDEFSRQEYASETWKACLPTTQNGAGRIVVISTGNGLSNERGGGNFFHHLWANADEYGIKKKFLPWNLHPNRDEDWYKQHAYALREADRGEQYPRDEDEAFILTGRPYFNTDALKWYRENAREADYRIDFVEGYRTAERVRHDEGLVSVYEEPQEDHDYAIGADVATGRGFDYSCAYVVDLQTMMIVAEFHGKLDADQYAAQIHYLGRWYNTALIAVETAGGYGEAVLIPLRDGRHGRPAYPKLYKHILSNRSDLPYAKPFGFPMNTRTRPLVISQLEQAIREQTLPFMPSRLISECNTFVHAETNPSPRAQDGCNDDCVMAAAITLEMYRLRGAHPKMVRRRRERQTRQRPEAWYPWQEPDEDMVAERDAKRTRQFDERYPSEATA